MVMEGIYIYTLTSSLHNAQVIDETSRTFLSSLNCDYTLKLDSFEDYGTHDLDVIFVRTGGTEGIFKSLLPELLHSTRKFYLLTSGHNNSLAASMEILSFLNNNSLSGEIIHGNAAYIHDRLTTLVQVGRAQRTVAGKKLGVIGAPSDWLISSQADYAEVKSKLGVEIIDIPMSEVIDEYNALENMDINSPLAHHTQDTVITKNLIGAERIYIALKAIVKKYGLNGFTIRCFDLLSAVKNTGCVALARFNSEGIVATCEGDVSAMLSMLVAHALTGVSGFQCNASTINPNTGQMLMAHCTIPFNMVDSFKLDTHFESGLGVGIVGFSPAGPITVFKISGDLTRYFAAEGTLVKCQNEPGLCRTQQLIALDNSHDSKYFLTRPIGNHHIVIPGHCKNLIEEWFK